MQTSTWKELTKPKKKKQKKKNCRRALKYCSKSQNYGKLKNLSKLAPHFLLCGSIQKMRLPPGTYERIIIYAKFQTAVVNLLRVSITHKPAF